MDEDEIIDFENDDYDVSEIVVETFNCLFEFFC